MSGLYIHIPFCASRCIYCGFYSTTSLQWRDRYVDALCKEMALRKDYLPNAGSPDIATVYVGGGTPSVLCEQTMERLFNNIYIMYGDHAAETTIECNPDDLTSDYAAMLSRHANRVSMGAQTFSDERLAFLRRRHTAADIYHAIDNLRAAGIRNISIDLMFGFPGQSVEDWRDDISRAISLNVEHISAYSLMYEEETPLYRMWKSGTIKTVDEEESLKMYDTLIDMLTAAGYEHYEISNFAKQGFRSRHNSSYWKQTPYIGIGASAHSYDISSRQWNVADLEEYVKAVEQGRVPCERETIGGDTSYNDYTMLSLRTCEGISVATLERVHGKRRKDYCLEQAQRHIDNGTLALNGDKLSLTRKGLFVSDMIMSDMMIV